MNTKNNLRYREMETRLEAAMLELMQQFAFEKITVKKLCETAGVNRSTFYAHFIDIYDMVEKWNPFCNRNYLTASQLRVRLRI